MSGPITDKNGQIVKVAKTDELPIVKMLTSPDMQKQFALALPAHIKPERIMRVAITAIRRSEALQKCSVSSLLGSLLTAAQLGLEVNTPLGFAFLIPFKGECTLQIGYQGYLDMGRRSGLISTPMATLVYDGDDYEVAYGLYPDIRHRPSKDADRIRKKIAHVYAFAHAIPKDSAPPIFVSLTRDEVLARKARSPAVRSAKPTPWDTDEGAMFKKTAIRALWPWIPKNVEMATAAALEDAHDSGRGQVEAWDSAVVDAMKMQGVVVDAVTEDGEVVDPQQAEQPEPPQARESGPGYAPPPPPPERPARCTREPGDD